MPLELIDGKLLAFYCLWNYTNNILSINARGIKMMRLDAPWYCKSNKS